MIFQRAIFPSGDRKMSGRKFARAGGLALVLLVSAILVGGCTSKTNTTHEKITVDGSTTLLPIAQAAAEEYMANHSNANIVVSGGGSGQGITDIGTGKVDIGMSSREVKASEMTTYPGLVVVSVAKDALTMIVNPSNGLSSVTLAQVKGIYNGTYTNWKQLGGSDKAIVLIGRESSSGSRDYFNSSIMKGENVASSMLEKNSNGAIHDTVGQTPGAIGYVGLGYIDSSVKALKIDVNGTLIEPSVANVLSKTYPVSRDLYMITNGAATGLAKSYIDFILSAAGQKIVQQQGFVPLA
jgi:phosphate transport system substrate-binding protein